jgi:hypothetical protein
MIGCIYCTGIVMMKDPIDEYVADLMRHVEIAYDFLLRDLEHEMDLQLFNGNLSEENYTRLKAHLNLIIPELAADHRTVFEYSMKKIKRIGEKYK